MRKSLLAAVIATAMTGPLLTGPLWSGTASASALPEVPARTISYDDIEAYPRQNVLPVYPDNPNDASIRIGVIPYDEIAPKLNELQAASDRVSARVAGKSANGLDLYAVTLTAPETVGEARQQERWKREIENYPEAAQDNERLIADYKTPMFINSNIHGNEWEGTDASLRVLEEFATSDDPAIAELLERNRLVFNITSNPDGRVAGTRANGAGYDLNRDMTIVSQPETDLIRQLVIETQPLITLDLHGYVNPTLLHPSSAPHNVNNEYDLFITHGLANALRIEEDIADLGYEETQRARIPFRDDEPGVWDDFPPIYVPSFAMMHSTIPYTIEAPLNPRGNSLSDAERVRRSAINTDVHEVAIKTSLQYIQDNREQMLFDQAEVFRRGWNGEPLRYIPDGFVPGWGPEDRYSTTFPRSYVIPAGEDQHSETAAARLVDLIIDSDGRVWRAKQDFTAGGETYEAGSYVIDMHQPKRGLVNSLLEPGADITDRVDDLYAGPAAWSHGLTWGATVDAVWDEMPSVSLQRSYDGYAVGDLPGGKPDLLLDIQDTAELNALNELLEAGVPAYRLANGSVVIPHTPANRRLAGAETRDHDVTFEAAPAGWTGTRIDDEVVVGYLGSVEVRDVLRDNGFEARDLDDDTLATTLTADVDVIVVGNNPDIDELSAENRAALDAFLARGGGVVGLGEEGADFSNELSLLSVTATEGPRLASGVVNVVNTDGPVASGAIPHSWIFQPTWFTDLGAGVEVEQSYAEDPLLSGWWGSNEEGTNGQQAAAGEASIVKGLSAGGNGVVLIGTSPTVRLHAKGLHSQFGRAILWASER